MSNNYQLVCLDHEAGAQYSEEVGNRNAKPASLAVKHREDIVKAIKLLEPLEFYARDVARAHWSSDLAKAIDFIVEHPTCEKIELRDEYGSLVAFEDEPDPHEGEDKFCSKCGGRLVGKSGWKVCINNKH